jgi:glycosyltransferase involved in cell wall biosynthesis
MTYKILFVVTSLTTGGAEVLLVQILQRLNRDFFQPVVVCLKDPGPLAEGLADWKIPVYSRLLKNKVDLRVFPRLVNIIHKEKVQVLWVHSTGDKMFWGRLAGKIAGVPVILASIHFMGHKGQRESILGVLNKALTPITDRFMAVSENQGRYLIEEEGIPAEKMVVIPNGIDLEHFHPQKGSEQVKQELGLRKSGFIIGQVANLRPVKNHRLVLGAVKRILEQKKEVTLLLIGDGPERKALENFTSECGLTGMVHFLGDRKDIPDLIQICDVGTLTSHMETFPVAALEYMALAKPVVAPDIGGIPELISPGIEGLLYPSGDVGALADCLLLLLSQPHLAKRLGEQGLKRVRDSFTLDQMLKSIEDLLIALLRKKGIYR